MSLSEIIKQECPVCKKIATEESTYGFGNSKFTRLTCGHIISFAIATRSENEYDSIVFADGKKPRPYQIDAIKFAEQSGFNCIIADEQGLGKTIEICGLLRLHADELLPAVICVPTSVKLQWMWEIVDKVVANDPERKKKFLTQVIQSGKERAMPGFGIYIITYDMLKKEDMFEYVPELKTIVIDECQRIKNHLSDRAKAVQRLCKNTQYHIPMSGTFVKNNAGEAFTVLNIVRPTRFPQYQRFLDTYCDVYQSGWYDKVGGLKDMERFREDTADIIIRRTKSEVLKDLPSLDRKFYHVDLDPKLNKAYAKALQDLDELFYSDDVDNFERNSATIEIMTRLRHITGISKVNECIDFVTEFLLSCDRKMTIFVHHKDVAALLEDGLNKYLHDGGMRPVLMLHSGLDGDQRANLVKRFQEPENRVMIASTLAAGEGINLQFCSDSILLERQWNPANEEQTEARFHRFGQEHSVSITYMIATGTIDEYFTELVEQKRSIVSSVLDGKVIEWDQQSLMKELTQTLLTKGRERWRF